MIELKNTLENDSWIEKLLEWANENDISLAKKKDELLNLTELDLSNNNLTELPVEIGKLTNLRRLYLRNNNLAKLPVEISKLTNLIELDLRKNPNLILTKKQKEWIKMILLVNSSLFV